MTEIPTDKHRAAGRRPAGNNAGLLTRLRRDALQALAADRRPTLGIARPTQTDA